VDILFFFKHILHCCNTCNALFNSCLYESTPSKKRKRKSVCCDRSNAL